MNPLRSVTRNAHNGLMVAILVFEAMLAAALAADPGTLGLSPHLLAWLQIANVGLVALANQIKPMGS